MIDACRTYAGKVAYDFPCGKSGEVQSGVSVYYVLSDTKVTLTRYSVEERVRLAQHMAMLRHTANM